MATYFPGQQYDPIGLAFGQGLGGGLSNLSGNYLLNQDLQKLQNWSGSGAFPNLMSPMGQQMGLQGLMQNVLGDPYGRPPWWAKDASQKQIEDYRGRVGGPMVKIETGQALLTPEQRKTQAEAEHRRKLAQKRLTPTDLKSARDTIKEIVGTAKELPFGVRGGPALKQEDMGLKWESVMASTGYDALDEVAQKQIENEFDRYVGVLNKGKGTLTLRGQYQWDRRKYGTQIKTQKSTTEPIMDEVEKGIREVLATVTDANVMGKIYKEAPKLRPIWDRLSYEEKITAYEKLAEGFTSQEIIRHFRGRK